MTSRVLTIAAYVVIALSLLVTELWSHRPGTVVPSLVELVRWAARKRSAQFGLLLVWWWLGWHFVLGL